MIGPGPVAPFGRPVRPAPWFAPEGLSRGLTPRIPDQIDAAIDAHQHGRATFDALADRAIQSLVGAPVTGRFDRRTAVQLAIFQSRVGLPADGIVDEPTTDVLLRECVSAGR